MGGDAFHREYWPKSLWLWAQQETCQYKILKKYVKIKNYEKVYLIKNLR